MYEWLRLRISPKGDFITYKHYHPENSEVTSYCDEFETKIENIEVMEKILNVLDFKEVAVVDKARTSWLFEDTEIVIDEVKGLGTFIEIEAKKHFENAVNGRSYLFAVLKKIKADVGEEDLMGYSYRLLEKKGYKFG